jgi:hypothetical protein
MGHDSSLKPETGIGDDHSLERKLYFYYADVGRPSFERQKKEVNREYVLVGTKRICKTIRIFLLNLINYLMRMQQE